MPTKLAESDRALFRGSRVVVLAAGSAHSAAVTAEGTVFVWRLREYGQLGLVDRYNRLIPTCVMKDVFDRARVLMMACGTVTAPLWS